MTSIREEAAGPSYTVPALCAALGRLGHEVDLHVLSPAPPPSGAFRLHAYPSIPLPGPVQLSPPMRRALGKAASAAAVMHTHGLWVAPNVYPGRAVRGTDCKLVLSPRGMLDDWALAHHAWRKKAVWALAQGRVVRGADCIHATADNEYRFTRQAGVRAPVAVIPNGVTIPPSVAWPDDTRRARRLLYLARIHPKKGVDRLVHAWSRLAPRHPDWELWVVGNDDGYLPQMRRLAESLSLERIVLTGKVPEEEKSSYYEAAQLYVLPTHAENWGVSIGEALAHGTPAIVGRGAPWQGLETYRCGWWIDNSIPTLIETLDHAMSLAPGDLRRRGRRGREWMEREYGWDRIGETMQDVYRWLGEGGDRPGCVVVD